VGLGLGARGCFWTEKRICATPALMQLDQQMGQVVRRAALHQDSYNSDQRAFRKALKTCKGDEACLTVSYQNRIAELQAFVNTLTAPTDDEANKLAAEADKAQAKRDDQADTREEIAAKVSQADAAAAEAAARVAQPDVIRELPQTTVAEEPVAAAVVNPAQPKDMAQRNDVVGWAVIIFVLLAVIGIVYSFVQWVFRADKRCPRCTTWWAGQVYDKAHESHIEHETKEFVDEHRNRNNVVVGTTRSQRQVAVNVSNTTHFLRCQTCQHEWAVNYQSRTS
jgi:uncharacterized protein